MAGKAHFLAPSDLLQQLSRNSTPYADPLEQLDWSTLDMSQFWLPETAISLYGLPEYARLPATTQLKLSQLEFIHLISQGLWLESLFMERMAHSLHNHRQHGDLAQYVYSLHEIREEAGHSLMFLELLQRSGYSACRHSGLRHRVVQRMLRRLPAESPLLWTLVLIGEELPDRMNRFIKNHRQQCCTLTGRMVQLHVTDEARHIAHARQMCLQLLPTMPVWKKAAITPLVNALIGFFVQLFYFPQEQLYQQAGLRDNPRHWQQRCANNSHRQQLVRECLEPVINFLRQQGIGARY